MAIDSTVGGAAANSYVTVQEADAYFATRTHADAWTGATSDLKERALITAVYRLDQESWAGRRASQNQALAWPRYGAEDADGYAVPSDSIPTDIKRAQMEMALVQLGRSDPLAATGLEGFERLKVGPIDIETRRGSSTDDLPPHVNRFAAPYLASGGLQFRIERG